MTGTRLVADVLPGDKLIHRISVCLGDDDQTTDISITANNIELSADGVPFVTSDASPYSAAGWITLDKERVQLEPGKSEGITACIQIPEQPGAGGRYALIEIKTQPADSSGIGIVSAFNIPVYLTLKGSDLIHEGEIIALRTGEAMHGSPVDIVTSFKNTGNHHFKVNNEVTIYDTGGKLQQTILTGLTASSVVPGGIRDLKIQYVPDMPGNYLVKSKVVREDGTVVATSQTTLSVAVNLTSSANQGTDKTAPTPVTGLPVTDVIPFTSNVSAVPYSFTESSSNPSASVFLMDTMLISPASVRPGQPVTVVVPVTNLGSTDNSLNLTFNINGVMEEQKSVPLKAGESRTAYFVTGQKEPGTYTIEVSGMTGTFSVSGEPVRNWMGWLAGAGAVILLAGVLLVIYRRKLARW